jgi:hypothetical protein
MSTRIRQGRLLRRWLTRVAKILSLAVAWPVLTCAQGFGGSATTLTPTCYAILRSTRLVSPGTGWVIVNEPSDHPASYDDCAFQHLYWTDNDGQTWREITPPHMPTRNIGQVFFLDRSHGWIIATGAGNEEPDARFYLLTTDDGGKTWRTLLIQRPPYKLMDDMFPRDIFFSDPRHGWILWHWAKMNSTLDSLLATSDGGRTWQRLPDPPGPGPMDFVSARNGWMIGASDVFHGIPDYGNELLWATHDGGIHWQALHAALPTAAENQTASFSAVRFKNAREGIAIAGLGLFAQASDDLVSSFAYLTQDGGKTWRFIQSDNPSAYRIDASIVGTHVIWFLTDFQTKTVEIRRGRHVVTPVFPSGLPPGRILSDPEFIDDLNAWVTYFGGRAGFDARGQRLIPSGLLSTRDGGKTFQIITPPAAARSVPISDNP